MRKAWAVAVAVAACGGENTSPQVPRPATASPTTTGNSNTETGSHMRIRLTAGQTVLEATMADNATTRDFVSLLPLTLKLADYANTER